MFLRDAGISIVLSTLFNSSCARAPRRIRSWRTGLQIGISNHSRSLRCSLAWRFGFSHDGRMSVMVRSAAEASEVFEA